MARETIDYTKSVKRMIRAAGRATANHGDEPELAELLSMHETVDLALQDAVDGMRARECSWAYIARATGTSRQAAQQRWGR